ncbi:DNA polymerase III subunit delta' [Rhodoblastus acidophilus]|uniref:DNA polymerase III subunit delta n=1 Tax=Candidatus Rhodoblastus alkanivorans TaxID=2954117 RepID=A0ABS9Z7N5_9HYPH|nr:DNA polymerase III subunit delta' [Candidatus Rhodoblastus alkanivorans]MCI4678753.1 DNA polymerase III subunit delta' [Candidatus Rhodoblastus alkanivorans]MCI4683451.1 DNA polymerase III subunit delta' [Candidatus Rhodoblastus alkanivorans]MDI4640765.1 DNA polymerase III subunit delta' [Rhodoblastus acidophilus]
MGVRDRDDALPESDRFEPAPHPRDTFQLFGQDKAERELLEAFRAGRMPQAWIIGGPPGIGKATLAWRMARFVAAHPDPGLPAVQRAEDLSVDANAPAARRLSAMSFGDLALLRREWNDKTKKHATRITVDDVRAVLHMFEQSAGEGGWRMAIIDSADDLNVSSANALLKLIEEPPPRSLFFLIAHHPGRILPTIRSRCRFLTLQKLDEPALASAARAALDAAGVSVSEADMARACARAEGSVREALRLVEAGEGAVDGLTAKALAQLPDLDWRIAHRIGDAVAAREADGEFDAFLRAIYGWLSETLRRNPGLGPRALAPYADAWEFLERETRDLEIYNLDKRAFVIVVFLRLAEAVGAARAAA